MIVCKELINRQGEFSMEINVEVEEKQLNRKNNRKIINDLRSQGKIGNKLVYKVDTIIPLLEQNRFLYHVSVLDIVNNFVPMNHPIHDTDWEVSFTSDIKWEKGDLLQGEYKIQDNLKFSANIIHPISTSLKKLSEVDMMKYDFGSKFAEYYNEKISGDNILSIISDSLLDYANNKKEPLQHEIDKMDLHLKNLREESTALKEKREKLRKSYQIIESMLGFSEESREEVLNEEDVLDFDTTSEGWLDVLQAAFYHYNDENLVYDISTIRRFIRALQTNQLVLLSGPSGTGKSSLVNQFTQMIKDVKLHHVAVQSNWMDVQDLLGMFNPVTKMYLPTAFIEALNEARMDEIDGRDRIHIICLDEMNLSHIEYYFSSFLSIREKKPHEQYIDLYANRFFSEAKNDLEEFFGKKLQDISEEDFKELNADEKEKYRGKFELVYYYPAKFMIPRNVRFVGTLNMDASVKAISPKVIDRSFVIELRHVTNNQEIIERVRENVVNQKLVIDIQDFFYADINNYDLPEDIDELVSDVVNLTNQLDIIPNARLNSRGAKHCKQYIFELARCDWSQEEAKDDLLCTKVLPRIQFNKNQEEMLERYEKFINQIGTPHAQKKAREMFKSPRIIQFWGS